MATQEEIDVFLAHHGVLGMHWGVRRDLHPSGSGVSAATVKDTKASEKAEAVKSIASHETRSLEKLNPSVSDEEASRFTPEQKRALKIAAGVAVTSAVLAFGVYEAKNNPDAIAKIASMAGKKISPEEFKSNVDFSKAYSWQGDAILKPSIVDHSEFSIPAGTTYHRISRDVEQSFNPITYATPSVEDFNRYLTSYGHVGGNPQHVSWESNSDIKVPGLPTVLGTFHEAMHEKYSKAPRAVKKTLDANAIGKNYLSPENVQRVYSARTGGHWTDSVAASFVSRLKEKGYGAIVDDMDSGILADTPIVLFSSEKMGAKRSVSNTEDIIAEAKRSLTELTNRKLPAHLQHSSVDEFLEHFGVKGMHWGVHKSDPANPQNLRGQISKIDAKLEKKDGANVLAGYGLKGWAGSKQYKKAIKKNPDFRYAKLSAEQKLAYDKKSYNMARRSVIGRTAVESALIVVGGTVVSDHVQTKNQDTAKKVTLLVLATNGAMRVSQLHSLNTAEKVENLHKQRYDLKKQLDQVSKKKK
jgi:hypothetical protein